VSQESSKTQSTLETHISEADVVQALRTGDSAVLDRWVWDVVQEILSGQRQISAIRHPLEFTCIPILRSGSDGLCLHLWEEGGDDLSTAHAHSWDLSSYVLTGTVFNEILAVENKVTPHSYRLYEVDSADGIDEIRPTGRMITLSRDKLERIPAGQLYRLSAGEFHRSGHLGCTSTVVLGEYQADRRDTIAAEAENEPITSRREACTTKEVLTLLGNMIDCRRLAR
jgi:hypothetical protein